MRISLSLLMVLIPAIAFRQKKHGYNRLNASYAAQYYLDKGCMEYDHMAPDDFIHPKNTMAHCWELQCERVTRYGLIVGAGLQYGVRNYDISIKQDMSGYDPLAVNDLNGFFFTDRTKLAVNYWGPKLMAGYRMPLKKKWAVEGKAGVALKRFFDGASYERKEFFISYMRDNGYTQVESEFCNIETKLGRDPAFQKHGFMGRNRFPQGLYTFEFYLGVEREINRSVIKNISIGIEWSRNWWRWNDNVGMTVSSSTSIGNYLNNGDHFYDRNRAIGLRVAVGLWK